MKISHVRFFSAEASQKIFSREIFSRGVLGAFFRLLAEGVDGLSHPLGVVVAHGWADGQAQLLLVDALGHGQLHVAQRLAIALLAVGRNGVVDFRLYVVVGKILLQLVATWREDWEDVVDV